MAAAEVAEVAGAQGKFWEMHNLLFERQSEWANSTSPDFSSYARSLDLDLDRFTKELRDHAHRERIQNDASDGRRLAVKGTPTLFINGREYRGAIIATALRTVIEEARHNPRQMIVVAVTA